jgi:hypothetical protein
MKEDGRISDKRTAALRLRLGLASSEKRGRLRSTAELAEGLSVGIESEAVTGRIGVIEEVTPDFIAVRTSADLPKGCNVVLKVIRPSGLYAVKSVVADAKGDLVFLDHSEEVKRIQKRRFFRRKMRGAVILSTLVRKEADEAASAAAGSRQPNRSAGQPSGPPAARSDTEKEAQYVPERNWKTRLLDLSAGGARIHNPGVDLEPGQLVMLTMQDAGKKLIRVKARVVRISAEDSSISVQFAALRDATRDKIAHIVLS